jgi:hypothetical protein
MIVHRVINWAILILGILAVPLTHGLLEYCGLILGAILLVVLNTAIARKRAKGR